MSAASKPKTRRLPITLHLAGLGLCLSGVLVAGWVLWQLSRGITAGQVFPAVPMARVWWWGAILFLVGLPFFFSRWRQGRAGKTLFDLAVGLLVTLIMLLLLEALFGWLNGRSAGVGSAVDQSEPIQQGDAILGYVNRPDRQIQSSYQEGGDTLLEVTYHTDESGRRVTPVSLAENRDQFLLFLGGSYTFGYLVPDEATLPAQVALMAPAYQPYNYGSNGYGPQQVYLWLAEEDLRSQIPQKNGLGIYVFLGHHVGRAAGSSAVINNWGHVMPSFQLDGAGHLQRDGTLLSARPGRAVFYGTIGFSQLARYFNVQLPYATAEADIQLTAALIIAARDAYVAAFDQDNFNVLIYPGRGEPRLLPYLDTAGVSYLDYSQLFASAERQYWLPEGHPSPAGYERVAQQLTADLLMPE